MCEENAVHEEELQQEDILPVEELTEEQSEENSTQDAPEEQQLQEAVEDVSAEAAADSVAEENPVSAEETEPEETADVEENAASEEEQKQEENLSVAEPQQAAEENAPAEAAANPAAFELKSVPYYQRYYLKYREGKRNAALDLDGTKSLLYGLGFDGGELRQAREGKHSAESFRNADQSMSSQQRCSYCGAQIAGVEFYRLPDGRVRCTNCSNTVVKSKAEVEALCKRVISNLDSFFGASIDVPVSIEVVEERKLKKKIGVPLGTQDTQSLLILGVAINKKKNYSIILENGAPRISLIATFAHELTHIWQYINWDSRKEFQKCAPAKRLLIYEGMAKWAEIQYLYLIGETAVARREEYITRNRRDEYGLGFCLYENYYPLTREAMACESTPFTPDKYPFS